MNIRREAEAVLEEIGRQLENSDTMPRPNNMTGLRLVEIVKEAMERVYSCGRAAGWDEAGHSKDTRAAR